MRRKIVAGNWKMNKSLTEAKALASELAQLVSSERISVPGIILCVPFPFLESVSTIVRGTSLTVGAQDCSQHDAGAYTGEVSAAMLKSMDVPYVIIGHSERRQYHGENSSLLARKIDKALMNGLIPIFCCGEPLEIRESGTHETLVSKQVEESLFHLTETQMKQVIIAYEPVWAIGTGKTATSAQAQEMHAVIRKKLQGKFGAVADGTVILYGGSVKPDNARELFSCADVDGGLVGGASLKARDFIDIIKGAV